MNQGLFKSFGAIVAWRCPDPAAFALKPLSMPCTLAPASVPTHYVVNHLRMLDK
jgi:hypothetical protein